MGRQENLLVKKETLWETQISRALAQHLGWFSQPTAQGKLWPHPGHPPWCSNDQIPWEISRWGEVLFRARVHVQGRNSWSSCSHGTGGHISAVQPNPTKVIISYNNFIIQQQNEGQNREKGSSHQGERKIISLQLIRAQRSSHISWYSPAEELGIRNPKTQTSVKHQWALRDPDWPCQDYTNRCDSVLSLNQ